MLENTLSAILGDKLAAVPRQVVRDLVKGVAGLVVNTGLIVVLVEFVKIDPAVAPVISLSFIMLFAYVATDKWTFSEFDSPETATAHLKLFVNFLIAYVSGHAVKYTIYIVLISFLPYLYGWPMAAASGFFISFVINRNAWSRKTRKAD